MGKTTAVGLPQPVVRALVRPLVRLFLRRSVGFRRCVDAWAAEFADVAEEELRRSGAEPTVSRISAMTGIGRREVTQLKDKAEDSDGDRSAIVGRVIGQWQHDRRYLTADGSPRVLSIDGKASEFANLVAAVTGDLNPYTVLFELERIGAVIRTPRGVRLSARALIVRENRSAGYKMLARDLRDLISAVDENLNTEETANLHLKTEFTRISGASMQTVRRWMLAEGSKFHRKIRKFLATHDLDITPRRRSGAKGEEFRVALGSYSFTSPIESDDAASDE
jgi:hypothetical protein